MKIFLALLVFFQFQSTYANSFRVYDISESSRTFEVEKFGEIRLEVSREKIVALYFENESRSIPIDFSNTEYESLVDVHSGRLARSSGENLYLIFDCIGEGIETGDIVVTIENYSVIKIWGRECNDL